VRIEATPGVDGASGGVVSVVDNAAIEGFHCPEVIESVPLAFSNRCIAHHWRRRQNRPWSCMNLLRTVSLTRRLVADTKKSRNSSSCGFSWF